MYIMEYSSLFDEELNRFQEIEVSKSVVSENKKILIYDLQQLQSVKEIYLTNIHKMQLMLAEIITPTNVYCSTSILRVYEYNKYQDPRLFKLNFSRINDYNEKLNIKDVLSLRLVLTLESNPNVFVIIEKKPITDNIYNNWFCTIL